MSPGLKRAREPYRFKNAVSGLLLGAIGVGIWAYSISAVKQDVFDDVDEEARELRESGVTLRSLEDEERDKKAAAAGAHAEEFSLGKLVEHVPLPPVPPVVKPVASRGLLAEILDATHPTVLDPKRKTLVWGAPSVDKIGSMKDSSEWGSGRL